MSFLPPFPSADYHRQDDHEPLKDKILKVLSALSERSPPALVSIAEALAGIPPSNDAAIEALLRSAGLTEAVASTTTPVISGIVIESRGVRALYVIVYHRRRRGRTHRFIALESQAVPVDQLLGCTNQA